MYVCLCGLGETTHLYLYRSTKMGATPFDMDGGLCSHGVEPWNRLHKGFASGHQLCPIGRSNLSKALTYDPSISNGVDIFNLLGLF